jgi:Rrf2 family nitric oxide-sensitive transcriptional repressor
MRLALHTDYALRTLMFLAAREDRASIAEIAAFFRISKDHLAKVAQSLVREGFVRSLRGVGGGLLLARLPESISLAEVIERFEGGMHLLDCVKSDNVCVIQPGCRLRTILAEAEQVQLDYLRRFTLADVVVSGADLVQLTVAAGPRRNPVPARPRQRQR